MFKNKLINKNFLDPKDKNYKILLKKVELILKATASNQFRDSPIRRKTLNLRINISMQAKEIPYASSSNEEIIDKITKIFDGCVRWNSPFTLLNITPSPLLDVVAATTVASLYNPNALWDFTSGDIILYEKKVIKALSELVGWDFKSAEGLSTYGGKATLLYAIKIGLHKFNIDIIKNGIKDDYFVIASDRAHYSISDVCNFIGIGSNNLIRISTDAYGKIILEDFRQKIESLLIQNKKIVCIILNAGTTIDMCVDPIFEIKQIVTDLFEKYKNKKLPHIHADSVSGWAWLFFKDFNLELLPSNSKLKLKKLLLTYQAVSQIFFADSFSADFHKTGLSPYCSTFLIVKNHKDIFSLTKHGESNLKDLNNLGDFHIHHFSFENSRSSVGIIAAWISLQKLGWVGFREYLIKMHEIGDLFKKMIINFFSKDLSIVNIHTYGFETLIKINFFKDRSTWHEIVHSSKEDRDSYMHNCNKFKNFIYNKIFHEQLKFPLIGFVPTYQLQSQDNPLPCYLIYPMCLYTNKKDIIQILNAIISLKFEFENNISHTHIDEVSNLAVPPR